MARTRVVRRLGPENDKKVSPPQARSGQARSQDEAKGRNIQTDEPRASKRAKRGVNRSEKRLFKVGIDYGTAYVAVAYAIVERGVDPKSITSADLKIIQDYPDDPKLYGTSAVQVPNVSWYSQAPVIPGRKDSRNVQPEQPAGTHFPDSSVIYGFSIEQQLSSMGMLQPEEAPFRRIERAKLLLSEDKSTEEARRGLQKTIEHLKRDRLIEKASDIIEDQLESILRHTKQQLQAKEGLDDATCDVEIVVTVPPTWKARADGTMVELVSLAALKVGFSTSSDIFLVSETEAAVNFLVESGTLGDVMLNLDTCTVLDCGGATCDISTLVVDRVLPVRLGSDMLLEEDGRVCASSFINERFKDLVKRRLEDETYLWCHGNTLLQEVERLAGEFEARKKPIDFSSPHKSNLRFVVPGLKENEQKSFTYGRLNITKSELWELFEPSLSGTADLLKSHLDAMAKADNKVQKVFTIGSFSDCQPLRERLRGFLEREHPGIQLVKPALEHLGGMGTIVARGAVLRSLNKEFGPKRRLRRSYGVLRQHEYQPEHEVHQKLAHQFIEYKELDGRSWVSSVDWIIQKGEIVDREQTFEISATHKMSPYEKGQFFLEEKIYVSDTCTESFWPETHPVNFNKVFVVETITVELSQYKDEKWAKKIQNRRNAKPHLEFPCTILLRVAGRNLRWEVVNPQGEVLEGSRGQSNISAGFERGTE